MNFLKTLINNLFSFRKKEKKNVRFYLGKINGFAEESNVNNKSLYSYIFNNDSIWLFYKKYDSTEKNINLKISF